MFDPKPHVSRALAHLRFSVQLCALVLGLSLVANVGVWATVYFTDARWTDETVSTELAPPARVVDGEAVSRTGKEIVPRSVTVEETRRVPSAAEVTMRDTWRLSVWLGTIAAVALLLLMLEGVFVAGGANVPGVEKLVTATSWTMVVVFVCLPLRSVFPAFPMDGVFSSYDAMASVSELIKAGDATAPGSMGFVLERLFLPLVCLGASAFVALRFSSGVERGVISRSAGEAELRLIEEMEQSQRATGVQGRAQGALSVTLEEEPPPPSRPEPLQRPLSSPSPGKAPGRVI